MNLRALLHRAKQPAVARQVHGWAALIWLLLTIPGATVWRESVAFVVFCSVYANFTGHLAGWQGARAEESNGS